MRLIKRLLATLLVVVIALVAIAYILPREVTVTRSTTINAAPPAVFAQVNALQAGENWSPWLDRDPDVQLTYSGPDSGVGNKLQWASDHPQVGNGTQEIIASTENTRVETALDFGDMGTAQAWFALAPDGAATTLTWGLKTDMGNNPIGRYMGLMMDRWVGADYEKGLNNLKTLIEG